MIIRREGQIWKEDKILVLVVGSPSISSVDLFNLGYHHKIVFLRMENDFDSRVGKTADWWEGHDDDSWDRNTYMKRFL